MGLRWRKHQADGLERAQRSLEDAREQRSEQERKRRHEQEHLIDPMQRLADENHLAYLVWDVVTGHGRQP